MAMDLNEGRKRKAGDSDPKSGLLKRPRLGGADDDQEDSVMKVEPTVRWSISPR